MSSTLQESGNLPCVLLVQAPTEAAAIASSDTQEISDGNLLHVQAPTEAGVLLSQELNAEGSEQRQGRKHTVLL